jgi:hypothetical protein
MARARGELIRAFHENCTCVCKCSNVAGVEAAVETVDRQVRQKRQGFDQTAGPKALTVEISRTGARMRAYLIRCGCR